MTVYPFKILYRLLSYLRYQKIRMVLTMLFCILNSFMEIIIPIFMGLVIDGIVSKKEDNLNFLLNLVVIYGVNLILVFAYNWIAADISEKLTLKLRQEVSNKIFKIPVSSHDNIAKGDIMSRLTDDLDKAAETLQTGFTDIISNFFIFVAALVIIFKINIKLAVLTLILVIFCLIVLAKIADYGMKLDEVYKKKRSILNSVIEENLSGYSTIKNYCSEKICLKKISRANMQLSSDYFKAKFIQNMTMPLFKALNSTIYIIIFCIGSFYVIDGVMTIGLIITFLQYINLLLEPIAQLSYSITTFQEAIVSAARIFQILDLENKSKRIEKQEISDYDIEFQNVSFAYETNTKILDNLSFKIKFGENIILYGPNGAGKTTIINLLLGFYEPNAGNIYIGGQKRQEICEENFYSLFGVVLQEPWVFSGTILENITYYASDKTLSEVKETCKLINIDYLINLLPDSYETIVEFDNDNISIGFKQLIAIARIMLLDPPIVILDEATSYVDPQTEDLIRKALNKIVEKKTCIMVSHIGLPVIHIDKFIRL